MQLTSLDFTEQRGCQTSEAFERFHYMKKILLQFFSYKVFNIMEPCDCNVACQNDDTCQKDEACGLSGKPFFNSVITPM